MADGISLGSAVLGLEANLGQLRADLDDAKARVATAVAEMQAMLDKLDVGARGGLLAGQPGGLGMWAAVQDRELARVRGAIDETDAAYAGMASAAVAAADVQVAASGRVIEAYGAQAIAAKAAADAEEAAAARSAAARSILGGIGGHGHPVVSAAAASAIWGVRGPTPPPGSIANPIVFVQEAASRTPLGSAAAAVGENAQGGGPEAVTVTTERNNARTVVGGTPGHQHGVAPGLLGLDAQRQQMMEDSLTRAIAGLDAVQRPPSAASSAAAGATSAQEDQKVAEATGSAIADALALEAAKKAISPNVGPGQVAKEGDAFRAAYEALGYTVASRVPGGPSRLYAPGGEPGTSNYGLTAEAALLAAQKASDAKAQAGILAAVLGSPYGAGSFGIPGLGPRSGLSGLGPDITSLQEALYEPEKIAARAGGVAGGGGGGAPPWLATLLWGHAGGGGGGGPHLPGWWGTLAGVGGIGAGFGSLGSFAGFGPEHIVLTLGGIAGSGVAALGGGALLGAGALGKLGAGAGSDLLVGSSAAADTKTLYTDYEKLREAVLAYGKSSTQAKEAQEELNNTMKYTLSNTKGVEAELHLAEKLSTLNVNWDKETSTARVAFVKLVEPLAEIAEKWIPLVNNAATQNFTATAHSIRPLFEYLKGPEAMGIFQQLENEFKNQIPIAMQALDQGIQVFGKTIAYTAPLTGAFVKDLDDFFTKVNTPEGFAKWESEMNKLIQDFDVWKAFIKELGGALVDLFDKDAHTGEGIIETLTEMLHKVREYEKSVAGGEAIHNIFVVHKEEAIALLEALVPLISSFSHIYTTVAPPLVHAVTLIAEGFTKFVEALEKAGPLGTWLVGLTVIAAKLKVLVPLLKAAGVETNLLSGAEDKNAAAAGIDAGAQGGLATTELAGGGGVLVRGASDLPATERGNVAAGLAGAEGGGLAGLLTKSNLLKAGIYGAGGLIVGSVASSALGLHGTAANSLQTAGLGVGVGFSVGGPLGAGIGALIGAGTPFLVKGISDLFASGEPAFKKEAEHTANAYSSLGTALLGGPGKEHTAIVQAQAAAREAERPTAHLVAAGRGGATLVAGVPNVAGAAGDYRREGELAGKEFVEAFTHVRFPTELGLFVSLEQHLHLLPKQAQATAAQTMLQMAEKLESEGKLPAGAVAKLVKTLEAQVAGLKPLLERESEASAAALGKAFKLTEAQRSLGNSLDAVEQDFGSTFAHTTKGAEESLRFLNGIIKSNAGPLEKSMAEMLKVGIESPLATVWAHNIEVNEREVKKINAELNTEIKSLGGSEIRAGFGGQTKPGAPVVGKGINLRESAVGGATGGLIQIGQPGAAGHDTVPLNVGGLPIMVAPGEQVAVFNRHQLPIVNAALGGMGGLEGLFGAVNTPNYMASGGLIPDVVQAGLTDVRKAEHAKLAKVKGAAAAHGGGGALGGASFSGSWVQVMRGIAREEGWSLADWEKVVQRESGGVVSIKNPSSTAFGLGQLEDMNWPTFGGGPGSSGVEQIIAMAKYIKATYGSPTGAWASEMSRGFYAHGGLPGFASGGLPGFAAGGHFSTGSGPKKAKHLPKVQSWKVHPFGKIHPLATSWWGQGFYNQLNSALGESGSVARLSEEYELASTADELGLQAAPHEGAFIYTPGNQGNTPGVPEILTGNVELRQRQLEGLIGTQNSLLGGMNQAWSLSSTVLESIHDAVAERAKAIRSLQAKIKANLEAIKKHHETIERQKKELAKVPTGKKASASDKARAKALEASIASEQKAIQKLEAENVSLGGNGTSIGDAGRIGTFDTQIAELTQGSELVTGDRHTLGGVTGHGGTMITAQQTLQKLASELTAIGGPALQTKLAEAKEALGGTGESALELAEREKAQLEEKLKFSKEETLINQQALSVFSGPGDLGSGGKTAFAAAAAARGMLIPASWIPSMDVGGVVPGARGAPQLILAHGEEEVLTPEQREQRGGVHHHDHWEINTLHPADPQTLKAIGAAATRGQRLQGYRLSKRLVPGA